MNPLQQRLAALRRRLRLVVSFRGVCWLLAVLIGCVVLAGVIDWLSPLPALIRAFLLVATLSTAAYVGYRHLFLPSCTKTDDLSLALRIEAQHPELNDALASTVQFLERADVDVGDSPALRREAVQQAMRQAQGCDFNKAIDPRGLRKAGLMFVAGAALAVYLLFWQPALAWTAIARLADPFGEHDWPLQTRLEVEYRARTPAGQPFDIRGSLEGEIPAQVTIEFEGMPSPSQDYAVVQDREGRTGSFVARLDMTRQQGSFRFRVRANDAVSPKKPGTWHRVTVVQPAELTAFRVRLLYPAYTDLPPEDVQSGYDSMDMVLGTQMLVQGTLDRRVARVWVEMEPARPSTVFAGAVSAALGARFPLESVAFGASSRALWDAVPAQLGPDGQTFQIKMMPRTSGAYDLRWQDDQDVGSKRSFLMTVKKDPAPEVKLDCLSLGGKSTAVTATAAINLRIVATDEEYAVRSAYLEYRRKDGSGKLLDDDWQRVPLYEHDAAGEAAPRLVFAGLAGFPPTQMAKPFRLRAKTVDLTKRWSLKGLVEEGNVLMVRATADDFDDVTPGKLPGLSSPPLEIQIVKPEALKPVVEDAIREVRDELVRLNEIQKNALDMVREAEQQLRDTGKLRPEDIKQLLDALAEQKKIEDRVGKDRREGLQKEVERIRRMLEDNQLPRSALNDKMDNVASALERLAKDRLGQVQDQLDKARKAAEDASARPQKDRAGELTAARRGQEEVQKTLQGLLDDLGPFVTIQEMAGKARNLRDKQQKLLRQTEEIEKELRKKDSRSDAARRKLDDAAKKQLRIAEDTEKLLGDMKKTAQDRRESDPEFSQMLDRAVEKAESKQVAEEMKGAAADLIAKEGPSGQKEEPKFNEAKRKQKESAKTLDEVIAALDEKREDELDRLSKKQQDELDRLEDLKKEMDELKKKVRDIKEKIKDPAQRRRELKKLAGKQRELQAKVDQMLRRLSRLRAEEAVQEMRRLSRRMEEAARQLDDGEDPEKKQQEALDRINDAIKKLEKANDRVENELAREKLAKATDEIKRLRDRQEEAIRESARIHKELTRDGRWDRDVSLKSLVRLKNDRQQGILTDTISLEKKLEGAAVFAHILRKAGQAMAKAVALMERRRVAALATTDRDDPKLTREETEKENHADAETQKYQKEASRRLQRLLDALKQDTGGAPPAAGEKQQQQPQPGDDQGGAPPPNQDGIPALAEQKALRAEQQEVNERTQDFDKRHPELEKVPPEEKLKQLGPQDRIELEEIHQDQKKVRELALRLFTAQKKDEGEKP
jgi:hypothetical protein